MQDDETLCDRFLRYLDVVPTDHGGMAQADAFFDRASVDPATRLRLVQCWSEDNLIRFGLTASAKGTGQDQTTVISITGKTTVLGLTGKAHYIGESFDESGNPTINIAVERRIQYSGPSGAFYLIHDVIGIGPEDRGVVTIEAALTRPGRSWIAELERRRAESARRRAAAANRLLNWLHEQDPTGVRWFAVQLAMSSRYIYFDEGELTDADFGRAAQYLIRVRLIEGDVGVAETTEPSLVRLADHGLECVEGGYKVADYLRDHRKSQPTIHNAIGTIHNNAGAISIGSTGVTQTVAAVADIDAISRFVQMLLDELPGLQLDVRQEAAAGAALDEVRREVSRADPDRGRITEALSRFVGYISDAGKPVWTAYLMLMAARYGHLPPQQ